MRNIDFTLPRPLGTALPVASCPPGFFWRMISKTPGPATFEPRSRRRASNEGSGRERGERGGIPVLLAGGMVALVGMTALVVDGGRLHVARAELQTVADLAAKSGARELARVYMDEGREDPTSDTLTASEQYRIAKAARQRGLKNRAGGTPIAIDPTDVQVGQWDDVTGEFVETEVGATTVQVMARRDSTANGELPVFFAGVFGYSGVPVRATGAARISGISYLPPGKADFPVAIAKAWFDSHSSPCSKNNKIQFQPTGSTAGCAGWHTFENDPASGSELKRILNGLRLGTFKSPELRVGETEWIFNGGTVTSVINELQALYDAKKNFAGEMAVLIPVYDRDDCSNPNGWVRLVGVARAVITKVESVPEKLIEARVQCDVVEGVESGGPDFGTLAAGPDRVR
jgi:hypothetical protein